MNVRTLCLSILHEQDATGYEIRRMVVEGECSYFVEASYGSIYPALAKLEADGLVSSRIEPQDGKPARKVYAITEAGQVAFIDALHEPLGDELFRSPFLLFARFAHLLPAELVRVRMEEHIQRRTDVRKKIEDLECSEDRTASDDWIIGYGRAIMTFAEQYMRDHMDELVALARPDAKKNAAE